MPDLGDTRIPIFVGLVTLVAGVGLVAAPERVTALTGLEGEETAMRIVGITDLALVPGLLAGPKRWPWMAVRGGLNLLVADYMRRAASRSAAPAALRGGAGVLCGLTVMDSATALALRSAGK